MEREKIAVQVDLHADTFVSGGLAGDGLALPYFGYLHIGRLSIYLAGRNGEVGPSARDLARRINVELLRLADESDRRESERQVALAVAVLMEPVPDVIPPEEIPH